MDALPQGQVGASFWQVHKEQFKTFTGSKAAYCRLHNIDYDQFIYYCSSASKRQTSRPAKTKLLNKSMFAKVEVVPMSKVKAERQLPEAKWLSELIHNLMVER